MNGAVVVSEAMGGRYLNHVTAGRHRWLADEPEGVGGTDAGPAPFQMLAAALGACTSMTLRMYAERKEWPLQRVTVSVSHEREGRTDRFVRIVALEGELDDEQRAALLSIANRCPVHRALEGASEIVTTLV